jgi:hypothetical protein
VRSNAASREGAECARFLQKSNTLLIAAALACKATGFARSEQLGMDALWPDWSVIDAQIAQFELERVEAPSIVPSAKVSFANLRALPPTAFAPTVLQLMNLCGSCDIHEISISGSATRRSAVAAYRGRRGRSVITQVRLTAAKCL